MYPTWPQKIWNIKKIHLTYTHTHIYISFPCFISRFCRRPPWKTRSFPKLLKSSMACGLARRRLELRPLWVSTRARVLGSKKIQLDVSENSGFSPPNHPLRNRVFHYKPSILGYPYFWKHPTALQDGCFGVFHPRKTPSDFAK